MAEAPKQPLPADEYDLPPGLAAALHELSGPPVAVPPAVDRAILADARSGFARRRRFRCASR